MIKFLVDSASDIDLEESKRLGVQLVPMQVRFGNEEYLDGINLSHRALTKTEPLWKHMAAESARCQRHFTMRLSKRSLR